MALTRLDRMDGMQWLIIGERFAGDTGVVIEEQASQAEAVQRADYFRGCLEGYQTIRVERVGEAPVGVVAEEVDLVMEGERCL